MYTSKEQWQRWSFYLTCITISCAGSMRGWICPDIVCPATMQGQGVFVLLYRTPWPVWRQAPSACIATCISGRVIPDQPLTVKLVIWLRRWSGYSKVTTVKDSCCRRNYDVWTVIGRREMFSTAESSAARYGRVGVGNSREKNRLRPIL